MKTLMCILFLCGIASAQEQPEQKTLDASAYYLIGSTAADYLSSQWLDRTKHREGNTYLGDNPAMQAALMTGTTVLSLYTAKMLRETGHPRAAKITNYIIGSLHLGAATWNIQLRIRK